VNVRRKNLSEQNIFQKWGGSIDPELKAHVDRPVDRLL
jgi:hypothetical protein